MFGKQRLKSMLQGFFLSSMKFSFGLRAALVPQRLASGPRPGMKGSERSGSVAGAFGVRVCWRRQRLLPRPISWKAGRVFFRGRRRERPSYFTSRWVKVCGPTQRVLKRFIHPSFVNEGRISRP